MRPYSYLLLLLLAGGLLFLLHLHQLSTNLQQHHPGESLFTPRQWIRKEPCAGCPDDARRSSSPTEGSVSSAGPPVQLPSLPQGARPALPAHSLTHLSVVADVAKNHRKLLLKTSPAGPGRLTGSLSARAGVAMETGSLARAQRSRQRLMREVCGKYRGGHGRRGISRRQVARIFVEDRHKLLYCEVPKAGCSNWKRVLMVLGGLAGSPGEIPHEDAHYANHLRRLDSFDRGSIALRLETYTKVLFLREPFERLVSAFRDKFESPNPYYHPVFGKPIISRYRSNASRSALRTGAGVTFKEFVQYLLDVHRPVGMDIHWEPVGQLCSPCLLDYDFIGKFETLEEEANYLLRSIGAPANLTFPSFKDRNPDAERTSAKLTQRYFAQLSHMERQRAFDFYFMDYLMFNYSKPFEDLY